MGDRGQQISGTTLAKQRLHRLAREYRQQGYQVTLHPQSSALPPALAGCDLDLVAIRGSEAIVAEVRTQETLTLGGPSDLARISQQVQQVPGWKFELVVTNPRR